MADEAQTAAQDQPDATPAHPDLTRPPAGPGETRRAAEPPTPAPAPTISLTMEQAQHYMGLQRQLDEIRAENQAKIDEAKQAELLAMAKAGDTEKALDEQRKIGQAREAEAVRKYRELEAQVFGERVDSTLADAISGRVFAGQDDAARAAAARMLKTILRGDVEAARDADGRVVVRDKASGRPAAEVLRERLSDPSLAFFFAPTTRGGSGGDGTRSQAAQDDAGPGSLDAIAGRYKAAQGQYGTMGLGPVG